MVLDIDQFRPEKGGDPEKVRENQRLRFGDVGMVDKIVESDEKWRKGSTHFTKAMTKSDAIVLKFPLLYFCT